MKLLYYEEQIYSNVPPEVPCCIVSENVNKTFYKTKTKTSEIFQDQDQVFGQDQGVMLKNADDADKDN